MLLLLPEASTKSSRREPQNSQTLNHQPAVIMKKDFKEIVQAMSAKEIIMAMVNGLKKPYTIIDMSTFGSENFFGDCYGCAATNAICEIYGTIPGEMKCGFSESGISSDILFVSRFEFAIDHLRLGDVISYNRIARLAGFAEISEQCRLRLPALGNDYTEADLLPYIVLADSQPTNP
jgi:hypothetical protein